MKPSQECRLVNLLALIEEAGSQANLARLTGVPGPYISQVSRAVPRKEGEKPRGMGDKIARQLEEKMGKPLGWMDADHSALSSVSGLNGREGQLVGLFRLLSESEQIALVSNLTESLRRDDEQPKGSSH